MKLKWALGDNSAIHGYYYLYDDNDVKLLEYGLWDSCIFDMVNGGDTKRQAIINGLIGLVEPHINAELSSKETNLIAKDVIAIFEAKIEELTNQYFEDLAKKEKEVKIVVPITKKSKLKEVAQETPAPIGYGFKELAKEVDKAHRLIETKDRKHNHYFKPSPYDYVDVYRVLKMFEVTDQAVGHAIKKLLVAGNRGVKDATKDIQEAIDTLIRKLEIDSEDNNA